MPETTPLIKAALNLRAGAGFDVYDILVMEGISHNNRKGEGHEELYQYLQL